MQVKSSANKFVSLIHSFPAGSDLLQRWHLHFGKHTHREQTSV